MDVTSSQKCKRATNNKVCSVGFKLKQLITRLLHELDDVDKCKDYQICLRKHYNLI